MFGKKITKALDGIQRNFIIRYAPEDNDKVFAVIDKRIAQAAATVKKNNNKVMINYSYVFITPCEILLTMTLSYQFKALSKDEMLKKLQLDLQGAATVEAAND